MNNLTKDIQQVKNLSYGDFNAYFFLWQKALLLVPLWAIVLVPIIGFVARSLGPLAAQMGYGIVLALCANYFFEDLLKRRIRLDNEHIFFGFKAIPVKEIVNIDLTYKKHKVLPNAIAITCVSGKTLKLSLNGLTDNNIETLLKHLQARNSKLNTAAALSTLIKCRRVTRKPVLDVAERLELPIYSRQLLDESIDAFRLTAHKWLRLGPAIVCLLMGPVWIGWLSPLYVCLQPQGRLQIELFNLQFLSQFLQGLQQQFLSAIEKVGYITVKSMSENHLVVFLTTAFIAGFLAYLQHLLLKPNCLIANSKGIKLALRWGEISLPIVQVLWSQIKSCNLHKPKSSIGPGKIRLTKTNDKNFDIDLAGLAIEDRVRLLKRLEKHIANCPIDPELSCSMMPKSEHSYTEIWLQSLTQAPQRTMLEPLEPGQILGEGRFAVLKRLGIGGQGTAYLCQVLSANPAETIVLKETIIPIFVAETVHRNALERFEHEARMLKSLKSEHTVKLLDYFIEDHRAYLVLEHIDGRTLRELVLENGPLSEEQAYDIALQMCEILELLHSHSIIHRDFTPDNLILNSKGKLKLIDFNVAQQVQDGLTGTIVGKHAYLPPEQFRGKATTQSDLYAFGATLFFLLTAKDPEPISQSSLAAINPQTHHIFDYIVKRATALQTNKRYENVSEITSDLLSINELDNVLSAKLSVKEAVPEHG